MITIDLGVIELYDSDSNTFEYIELGKVRFEYSLKAIYEWEAKWKKPFLKGGLNDEEYIDFYLHMALDPITKESITYDVAKTLSKYITEVPTATTFSTDMNPETKTVSSKAKFQTAEELYAIMINAGVPIEFEDRNLNRLLTILRIISIKNEPPKKMSQQDVLKQNASLNEQRKAMLKTKG